jgi:hypothetical protein
MSTARDNTHRIPFTRACFRALYNLGAKNQEYRTWLERRQAPLCLVSALEKDLWTVLSGGLAHRLHRVDEVKVAGAMTAEQSIRGLTLVDQLTVAPTLQTLRLGDIRLAHPLALERAKSQRRKYVARCAALRSWSLRKAERFLSHELLQELIPSSDPIIVTRDSLERAPYVVASGNGRLAALKAILTDEHYVEVLSYLR